MASDNPITQLIKIIETSVLEVVKLVVEMKGLIGNLSTSMSEKRGKHDDAIATLHEYGKAMQDIKSRLDAIEQYVKTSLINGIENIIKSGEDNDRCISDRCPQKKLYEELKADKMRIIEAHEKYKETKDKEIKLDTTWWKRVTVASVIISLIFAIGMILAAWKGQDGIQYWIKHVLMKVPVGK